MTAPTRERIKAEFDAFIEFPDGSDQKFVTSASALLFAETIASMLYAAGAEQARQDYERERARHSVPLAQVGQAKRALIDALVGDALTGKKAEEICRDGMYEVTGVILTRESGEACLVNRQAVRWLSGDRDMHDLMFPNHRPDPIAEAVAAEREACAKLCECLAVYGTEVPGIGKIRTPAMNALLRSAEAIRARGAA